MPSFSLRSEERLMTCHPKLQMLMAAVVKHYDISIICGHRNAKDQNAAYASNNSKVQWPNSKHNEYLSNAVDVVPYPSMWDSNRQFYFMAGVIQRTADTLGFKIRWGGDWDMDSDLDDNKFMDLGHFELVN